MTWALDAPRRARAADAAALSALAAFAFKMAFVAGERGFFPFDQGPVFDGGYRIASGQVPYKDFLLSFTPLVYALQALFFKWLGVNYFAFLFAAACVNAAAALLSAAVVRLLFPDRKAFSYLSGFLTAIWFYPPFGTPIMERTAFFFVLLVLAAILWAAIRHPQNPKIQRGAALFSGMGVTLVFLSKQNVAPMFLPLVLFLWLAGSWPDRKRGRKLCAAALAGLIASAGVFFLWLWAQSDVGNFVKYSLSIPMQHGAQRGAEKGWQGFFQVLTLGWFVPWKRSNLYMPSLSEIDVGIRLAITLAFAASVCALFRRRRTDGGPSSDALAAALCIGMIYFQYLFAATSSNSCLNGLLLIGPIVAIGSRLGLGLIAGWSAQAPAVFRLLAPPGAAVCASLLAAYLAAKGVGVALTRRVHNELFNGSEFVRVLAVPALEALKWGEPTLLPNIRDGRQTRAPVRAAEIAALAQYLSSVRGNFFVFPDFSIFYGAAGSVPPQPLIEFSKGKSYPQSYDRGLDEWIVRDLKRADVRAVVLEKFSFKDTELRLNDFPMLRSYIEEGFRPVRDIGIFQIYEPRA